MTQRFVSCDREQVLLLPVSLREWLPENHLAWFVLAAVEELDLSAFYAAYRQDANGRPAHDPAMMVALLLYAYARGQRSSRVIERECVEDIAFRVIAANQRPDHCTIARFRQRHEIAIWRSPRAVCRGRDGQRRSCRDRRNQDARQCVASRDA
ncbi:MAG TPA: transposase [Solirubrobacteraceae bacterium]|nr:transposase [Solirubrobacteraceae bacterium]